MVVAKWFVANGPAEFSVRLNRTCHRPAISIPAGGTSLTAVGRRVCSSIIFKNVAEKACGCHRWDRRTSIRHRHSGGFRRPSVMWLYCAVGSSGLAPGFLARPARMAICAFCGSRVWRNYAGSPCERTCLSPSAIGEASATSRRYSDAPVRSARAGRNGGGIRPELPPRVEHHEELGVPRR